MATASPQKAPETSLDKWRSMKLSQVMDQMAGPIVVADEAQTVIYANAAAIQMFERIETEIRKQIPDFEARRVVGRNISVFHKDPSIKRDMVAHLKAPHEANIDLGGRSMDITATPVTGETGALEYVVVEWRDVTEQKAAARTNQETEEQFDLLIEQMNYMAEQHEKGDIDVMIDTGLFNRAELTRAAEMCNGMVQAHIDTKKAALAVVEQFGEGNFDAPFPELPGKKVFINHTIEKVRGNFREVVNEIRMLSDSIVAGNLNVQADLSKFKGEYRSVVQSFDEAFSSLNTAFTSIAEQIDQVAASVGQVSDASQTLSANSQITSSSVEEVSASMAQTDQQVRANAESSQRASHLVTSAANYAQDGSGKIRDMVDAMHGIKASSQDIAKIIKVIDEIAFQTNLLALNAAVEAARAGPHGRGFAVVAQEVRNLAGRSAKAARETSQLIDDANTRVGSGVRIADETRDAFTGISDQITQVRDLIEEIDRASAEQTRGVAQISLAMSEISKAASETNQQADELAAGSAQMTMATEKMKDDIQRFKLRRGTAKTDDSVLAQLSPEMLMQLQQMINAKPANGHLNGTPGTNTLDVDARGYGPF